MYDPMHSERGADFNCFSKWLLDWIEPMLLPSGSEVVTLSPSSTHRTDSCVFVTPGIEKKAQAWLNLKPEDLPTDKAVNINFARIDSAEGVKEALARTGEVFASGIDEARRGVIAQEETRKLANLIGLSPEKLLRRRLGQAFDRMF